VIVLCNGQAYVVDAVDSLSGAPLSPPEWELQLQVILSDAEYNPGPGLGRLTCDNRDIWAEVTSCHLNPLFRSDLHRSFRTTLVLKHKCFSYGSYEDFT